MGQCEWVIIEWVNVSGSLSSGQCEWVIIEWVNVSGSLFSGHCAYVSTNSSMTIIV